MKPNGLLIYVEFTVCSYKMARKKVLSLHINDMLRSLGFFVRIHESKVTDGDEKSLVCINKLCQFSGSVVSDSFRPHGLQHTRPPCPSPTPGVYSNSCPSHRQCHPTISSSVVPSSSCPQSFPASGSFPMSQFFASGGQSIGVSASVSVLPVNIQDWFPLGLTGWISLQSTVQKQQFFGAQRSL